MADKDKQQPESEAQNKSAPAGEQTPSAMRNTTEGPTGQQAESDPGFALDTKDGSLHPIIWILAGLFILFIIVGFVFLIRQSTTGPTDTTRQTPGIVSPAVSPTPLAEEDLSVPTVSDDTSLETIEREIEALEVGSPESDLEELDKEAQGL